MNLKQLIESGFFPRNDADRPLVPRIGFGPGYLAMGDVAIIATNAPGAYPIVGLGTGTDEGEVMQFDENGRMATPFKSLIIERELVGNSLRMPTKVIVTHYALMDYKTGWTSPSYRSWDEAAEDQVDNEVIVTLSGEAYVYDDEEGHEVAEPTVFMGMDFGSEPSGFSILSILRSVFR